MKNLQGFTVYNDENIELQLSKQIVEIADEIIKTFREVDSIILAGGFGRGEGSIRFSSGGQVEPLKDYDVYVVTNSSISEKEYSAMIERIYRKLRMEYRHDFSSAPEKFNIDIQVLPRGKLSRLPPDISTVDLKMASKVIYGDDLRSEIPASSEDITLSSGTIVLFNKVVGLLQQMDPAFLGKAIEKERREPIVYECGKTFIEMCTALLIMSGDYVPYYSKRASRFDSIYAKRFLQLNREIPDLPEKVKLFTELKLNSDFDDYVDDPVTLWFITREYLGKVLRYYLEESLGIDGHSHLTLLADEMYEKMGYVFFRDYLDYNLRRLRWYHSSFLPLISFAAQIYDNVSFIQRIWAQKKTLHMGALRSWRSPIIKIFAASILALYALREDFTIDENMMKKALNYLQQAYPYREIPSPAQENWDTLRKKCVEAQKLYFKSKVKRAI